MKLSILDQSPINKNTTAREALQETAELAKLADKAGFTRFWVSEHHNTTSLAGSTPEVLIAHLATQTKHIKLGSGGIMLPHYSAFKVAENFRMLECLFPGRIDLGFGRAPGGDSLTANILNPHNRFSEEDFVQQVADLQNFLNDSHEPGTVLSKVKAIPVPETVPAQWILSSSGQSGVFAAHFGMGFSFAHFINPIGGPNAVKMYKHYFEKSINLYAPQANVAVFVFCSEDEEEVRQQQIITDYRFIQFETRGRFEPVTYDEIKNIEYTEMHLERIKHNRQRMVMGTPQQVKTKLTQLANDYGVDEVIAANITLDFELRMRSFKLLAEAFELDKNLKTAS